MANYKDAAVDVIMLVVATMIVAAMALTVPSAITAAGFTGAAATIVGLIPMIIPVSIIVMYVMRLIHALGQGA